MIVLDDPYIKSTASETIAGVELRFPVFDAESLRRALPAIRRQAHIVFDSLSAADIQSTMDRLDRWFADVTRPEIADIIDIVHRIDGFSKYDIERFGLGIFPPLVQYDRDRAGRFIEAAFRARAGKPVETAFGHLERFGATGPFPFALPFPLPFPRWREPELLSHFVSGNVVGYSAILTRIGLPVRRGGAAQVIKLPSASAAFPMIYLAKMAEFAPHVRRTMACGYWKGGDRAIEEVVLADSDAVNVLGSDATIRDVAERARRLRRGSGRGSGPRILAHGHKIGAAYVARVFVESPELRRKAIDGLVRDISAFDGAACYCVKNIYVEGEREGLGHAPAHARFAEELADALGRFARDVSPVRPAARPAGRMLGRVFMGASNVIAAGEGSAYVKVGDRAEFWLPDETYRYVQVMPASGMKEVAAVLKKARPFLQTVVAAVPDGAILEALDLFGRAGASNIHYPGSAPLLNVYEEPHDGDFDFIKARYPYRCRFAATNFKRNASWL